LKFVQKKIEPDDEKFATKVEEEADEAICITMLGVDGALSITRSSHSVGQSLAILTVKLMIGLPIGLWGTVAMATAATEIKAAVCDREHHEVKEDEDLSFLIEQMKPGWSAVIAVYAEYYVQAAVKGFLPLQATMVWHAPESEIESVIRSSDLDVEQMKTEGIPATKPSDMATIYSMLVACCQPVYCILQPV